jgi:hypothetical protein
MSSPTKREIFHNPRDVEQGLRRSFRLRRKQQGGHSIRPEEIVIQKSLLYLKTQKCPEY